MSITMKYNHVYNENSCTSGVSKGSMATRVNYSHKVPKSFKKNPHVSKWQKRKQARYNNLHGDNKPQFMKDKNIGLRVRYNDKSSTFNNIEISKMYPAIKKQYENEKKGILQKSKTANKDKSQYLFNLKNEEKKMNLNELSDIKKREKELVKNQMLHKYNMMINSTDKLLHSLLNKYKNGLFELNLDSDFKYLLENKNPILNKINEYYIKVLLSNEFKKEY